MNLRSLAVLFLCLAFLGTRVAGLHFHVSEGHEHDAGAASHHDGHAGHAGSRLTFDLATDHLSDHVSNAAFDAGGDPGLLAKVPDIGLPVLLVVFWLAFALSSRLSAGLRLSADWFRPPPIRRWPTLLLPPSQGPPRAF